MDVRRKEEMDVNKGAKKGTMVAFASKRVSFRKLALGMGLAGGLAGCIDDAKPQDAGTSGEASVSDSKSTRKDSGKSDGAKSCLSTTEAVVTANVSKKVLVNGMECRKDGQCQTPLSLNDIVTLNGTAYTVNKIGTDADGKLTILEMRNKAQTSTVRLSAGTTASGSCIEVETSEFCTTVFKGQEANVPSQTVQKDKKNYTGRAVVVVSPTLSSGMKTMLVLDEDETKKVRPFPYLDMELSVKLQKGLNGTAYIVADVKVGGKTAAVESLGKELKENQGMTIYGLTVSVTASADLVNKDCTTITGNVNVDVGGKGNGKDVNELSDGSTLPGTSNLVMTLLKDTAGNGFAGFADKRAKSHEDYMVAQVGKGSVTVLDEDRNTVTVTLKKVTVAETSE